MEVNRQRGLKASERLHCANACKALASHSIHESLPNNCLLKDCYICADLEAIDDRISTAYEHIFDLIQSREQIIKKANHEPLIHRLPVEILALTFVFVKEAYVNVSGQPSDRQPYTSPPLLVGAICKKWRDITLRTPRLWTDINVDLGKPANTQLDMINEWACRSGALPLNIEISLSTESYEQEEEIPEGREDVAQALRSLVSRWNDVALSVPWDFCHSLFDDLEEFPTIGSLHIFVIHEDFATLDSIELRHPFRPKRFCSWNISGVEIPCEWENLVHLEMNNISDEQEALHIMRHASNLRHWEAESAYYNASNANLPEPTTYITNRWLTYFKSNIDIMNHLILPSLQHLHCSIGYGAPGSYVNSLSHFIDRSRPPLQTFFLEYDIHPGDPDISFRKLPGITTLHINDHDHLRTDGLAWIDTFLQALVEPSPDVILPRLAEIRLSLPRMTPSSWSLFARLFRTDTQPDRPGLKDVKAFTGTTFGRPLSKVFVGVPYDDGMDKDTFLHLLAVRKSGVKLDFRGLQGVDLFSETTERYNVKLGEVDNRRKSCDEDLEQDETLS